MRLPRRRITRILAGLVAFVVVLVVAFEGYAFYTRHTPTHYKGGPFLGASTPTPGVSTAPAPNSHLSSGESRRAKSIRAAPTSGPGTSSATAGSGTAAPAGGPTPVAEPTLALPRVGQYTLAVSGRESVDMGPLGFCSNAFPNTAQLGVEPTSGAGPTSFNFDLRLYPGEPNKHDERHIYTYSTHNIVENYEEAVVTCGGVKQSTTVNFAPPQLRLVEPLYVGEHWSSHGGDSSRTEDTSSMVSGTSTVTVQGSTYPVYVVVTHVTMTGSEHGTRVQTWWYSPTLAMYLQFAERINASRTGLSYTENYTSTVTRLPS
jgi:hypothetical protein